MITTTIQLRLTVIRSRMTVSRRRVVAVIIALLISFLPDFQRSIPHIFIAHCICSVPLYQQLMALLQLRFEYDSSAIRARFEHDSATRRTRCLRFEHDTTSYEEPTRSYALSSGLPILLRCCTVL